MLTGSANHAGITARVAANSSKSLDDSLFSIASRFSSTSSGPSQARARTASPAGRCGATSCHRGAAAVVPGPAGFFGSDISQGAAGADQPIHLQVQILVLRLSHRDPGVTVERHPAAPLAGMGKSIPSCQGEINRVFQPPPELRQGGIPSRGRKQGCFQPWRPGACCWIVVALTAGVMVLLPGLTSSPTASARRRCRSRLWRCSRWSQAG